MNTTANSWNVSTMSGNGYIISEMNRLTKIYNVIYDSAKAGIDTGGVKYVTVCGAHNVMISSSSLTQARVDMVDSTQWCDQCRVLAEVA